MKGNNLNSKDEQNRLLIDETEIDDLEQDLLWQKVVKDIYDINEDINLDNIINKIDFKNPRPAINIFITEKIKKEKIKVNDKIKIKEINKKLSDEFNKLKKEEKKSIKFFGKKRGINMKLIFY